MLAIMTTDPFPKETAVRVETSAGTFHIGGMAKGSGMIEPLMATMLAFLTCDAQVEPAVLRKALAAVTRDTFNAITVDGECSTNDTVFAMANGASGVVIDEASYPALEAGLRAVSRELALAIVRGGEGATKLVRIRVEGAKEWAHAERAARTIANSLLVKTAIHGGDPNWGRLVAAAGRSGVPFDLARAAVRIGGIVLFDKGQPYDANAERAAVHLSGKDIEIELDLGTGGAEHATIWTCDLSAEYVRINADYRT
jgi:glutamate N-acetyltransferase/amino-acid N-acetyltransferase